MFNFVEINLYNLLENFFLLKASHKNNPTVIAMVKANAYGHGLSQIAQNLQTVVEYFGVASLYEALALRTIGIKNDILIFAYFNAQKQLVLFEEHKLTPIIHSRYQYDFLKDAILRGVMQIWIHINTGMNNMGVNAEEFDEIYQDIRKSSKLIPINVLSHFSEPEDISYTEKQINLFEKCIRNKELNKISLSGTATIKNGFYNTIRPGIGLYGINPKNKELFLKPVMSFKAQVISIRVLNKGECIGYNREYCTTRRTLLATLSVGYSSGYPRLYKLGVQVMINDRLCNVVGQVSMDVLTIDVTEVNSQIKIGDVAELWGEKICINTVAKHAHTIPYTLAAGMPEIVKRIYLH